MTVYLASPATQQQAEHVSDMPVLLSFACWSPWLDRYQQTFRRILIDSGAYSELNSGQVIDGLEYRDWHQRWDGHADAIAGLDDIRGDWKRSLHNYEQYGGFPTFHDTDPPELLDELIDMSRERGNWLGLGLLPPRHNKDRWVRETCERIPNDIHIHGWAMRLYASVRRLDSMDSTNWYRDAMKLNRSMRWLTYGECLSLIVKRYQREQRIIVEPQQQEMF